MLDPRQPSEQKSSDWMGWLYFLSHCHATAFLPFLRSGQGAEAYGINGLIAFLGLFVLAADSRQRGFWLYFMAWLAALIYRRIQYFLAKRRGEIRHSRYDGRPWLALKVPFVRKESTARALIEPMICLFGGVLLCPFCEPLGQFVMLGFLTLMVKNGIEVLLDEMRLRRMRDAAIEQQDLSERFRRGDPD